LEIHLLEPSFFPGVLEVLNLFSNDKHEKLLVSVNLAQKVQTDT
jgi:hypothetical protein